MAKKTKTKSFNHRAFWKIAAPTLVLMVLLLSVVAYALYKPVVDNPTSIREALIRSIEALNKPAPVEGKTGDIYFPEAKLYIPRGDRTLGQYEYTYDKEYSAQHLSITTKEIVNDATFDMYNAQDSEVVFAKVPRAQACSRGIMVTDRELVDLEERKLHHHQKVADGRELYVYTEPSCAMLLEIMPDIERLQSY